MANTFQQPTQSDLEREQFRLGLASAQSKAYTQSQANPSQSATEIDYTTAPDRISLYDLNKLNQSVASGTPKSDSPVLDAWKRQQAAKSAAGTDYTAAPDRVSFYDLRQMDKSATPSTPKSDSPVLDFWKRQQAAKSAAGTDYTYALDRVPFTQANAWTGGAAAETKATNLSSAQQSVPWLNTPQYGDDGAVFPTTAAQTGKTGYNGSGGQAGLYRPDTDYTYALDRVPFTQVNTWTGGTETGTKATGRSSAQQPAPWLNTPQYGDDGTVLPQDSSAQGRNALPYDFGDDGTVFSKDKLAQYGSRGYDESIWENNPVRKALRQVALGSYAGETTPLGTALQILAGLAGVDAPADVRDLFYDLTHWEDTAEHRWQLMLDLVAVLPLIGAVKNAGKAGDLAQEVLRHGDEISSVLNALPSGADEAAELIGDFAKHSDEAGELAQDALKHEDDIDKIISEVFDEEDELWRSPRNIPDDDYDWLADVTEDAGDVNEAAQNYIDKAVKAQNKYIDKGVNSMNGLIDTNIAGKKSWYKADGTLNMPPNDGAVLGTKEITDLQPGTRLGRYGGYTESSDFLTEAASSADSLSLPPYTDTSIYQEFEVLKLIPRATKSLVEPWGNSTGWGKQFKTTKTIAELRDLGYIRLIMP